jgi:phosphatidylserine decarboxylase
MKKIGLNLENYSFVNHKLLLTFYHRIHSPVSGTVERIIPYPKEEKIFGENALWILDINTGDKGHVYFMLVGESEIQDFNFLIKEGQHVEKFEELGNFNWGSQTVLFYDNTKFGFDINVKPNTHFFVGDKIF